MGSTVGVYAVGAVFMGLLGTQFTYSDMLRRARRKKDIRVMSLHHMIHHDEEFNVLGMRVPSKWFGGAVVLDQPKQYIVATKSIAYDYTVIATGRPCLHCGFLAKENTTDIIFSSLQNMRGLDFPSARHYTALLYNTWMSNEDLKSAQRAYFEAKGQSDEQQ